MMLKTIPAVLSWVVWQSSHYQVRKRTRNRDTQEVTLWLCNCGTEVCQHPLQKVALAECHSIEPTKQLKDAVIADCQCLLDIADKPEAIAAVKQAIATVFAAPEQNQLLWNALTDEQRQKLSEENNLC
jgi:hypothetical protein